MGVMAGCLWGISGVFAKILFTSLHFQPGSIVSLRMIGAGTLLLLFSPKRHLFSIFSSKKDTLNLLIFAIVGLMAVQLSYFFAIQYSNAATATILQYLAPIFVLLYVFFKNRSIPSIKIIAISCLSFLGVVLLVTNGNLQTVSFSFSALFFGIGAAVSMAFYTVQSQHLLQRYHFTTILGWGLFIGGVVLFFFYPIWHMHGSFSIISISFISFIIIFGTLLPYYLYLFSTRYISTFLASVLSCSEPLSATLLTVLFLDVRLGWASLIGGFLIIFSVLGVSFQNKS